MVENKQKGFDYIYRQKNLKENDNVLGLIESEKLIGQLYPVLIDEQGNVLDGQHRLKANPNWRKEVVKGIDSDRKKAMVRLHANWHRQFARKEQILSELALVTDWHETAAYAAFLGCSIRTIQRYLPQKYKQRQRSAKRQVSLSESKDLSSYEVELRDKFFKEEDKFWPPRLRSGDMSIKAEIDELQSAMRIVAMEKQKGVYIWNYFYKLSDEEILAYVAKVGAQAKERVQRIANELLNNRKEIRERKAREDLFNARLEELYAKFKQITVEFTDGTSTLLNLKFFKWWDFSLRDYKHGGPKWTEMALKKNILPTLVKEMLGFDETGHLSEGK
jgi:hypothetical protein